jgi:chromosomal replication initiator protein
MNRTELDLDALARLARLALTPEEKATFARQLTESSLASIGDAFGGRDHGTVLHACRQVKDRMEVDANVRQAVSYLEKQLQR